MRSGTTTITTKEYAHLEIGKDIPMGIAGYYTPYKEVRLPYKGREVFYVTGKAVIEASCCGTGNWTYATVPGYIIRWHSSEKNGLLLSETEPIADQSEREEIRKIIEDRESYDLIHFA